jgi:hypothetical protein
VVSLIIGSTKRFIATAPVLKPRFDLDKFRISSILYDLSTVVMSFIASLSPILLLDKSKFLREHFFLLENTSIIASNEEALSILDEKFRYYKFLIVKIISTSGFAHSSEIPVFSKLQIVKIHLLTLNSVYLLGMGGLGEAISKRGP